MALISLMTKIANRVIFDIETTLIFSKRTHLFDNSFKRMCRSKRFSTHIAEISHKYIFGFISQMYKIRRKNPAKTIQKKHTQTNYNTLVKN